MMRTRPARRTTLQCSHRTLTDGLTFISCPLDPSPRSSRPLDPSPRSSRPLDPSPRSSRGRPGAFGPRPPLISASRTISPLVSGPPGCLRPSAAPHLALLPLEPVRDPAARQVVGGELHLDLVPGQDPDEVHAHLAGHVREHLVSILQLHAEHGIRKRLD